MQQYSTFNIQEAKSRLFALPHPIKPRNGEATAQIIDQHNKTYTSSIHYLGMRGSRKVSCDALANKKRSCNDD